MHLTQLSGTLSEILNRTITLPTITADMVPSQAVATLGTALGVSLPPTFGSVTLFQSDQLTSIQDAVSTVNNLLLLSIVLFVVGIVLALVLSTNRRRTLLQLLAALIVVVVLERRFAIAEANNVVDLAKPENQAAVQAIIDAFLGSLLLATKRILWVLFVVLVVAVFTGPYPWAVRFRGLGRGHRARRSRGRSWCGRRAWGRMGRRASRRTDARWCDRSWHSSCFSPRSRWGGSSFWRSILVLYEIAVYRTAAVLLAGARRPCLQTRDRAG